MTGPALTAGIVPAGPMLSMFDPIYVGIDEFGHPASIRIIYNNILAAGQPGGGKSGLMNTLTALAALSALARLALFDGCWPPFLLSVKSASGVIAGEGHLRR